MTAVDDLLQNQFLVRSECSKVQSGVGDDRQTVVDGQHPGKIATLMHSEHANLLRSAFDAYLLRLDGVGLEPSVSYLTYDFDQIDRYSWQAKRGEMVRNELQEITNILNHWQTSLHRWQAWNAVIRTHNWADAWELHSQFLDALAHQCLLQPSAVRDILIFVATNSMHQVRLASESGYLDYLKGDPESAKKTPKNLTRRDKEQRLADLIAHWSEAKIFLALLRQIDDASYRESTSDYRNRSSHAIGPRLAIGLTRTVVRSVVPVTEMKQQANGTFVFAPIPGKMQAVYGFGGTEPLDMEEARIANLGQYRRARECYDRYLSLLAAGMAEIPLANSSS